MQLSTSMQSRVGTPVIAVVARKGGVGKSMLASLLARGYARSGLKVLVLDLDPQGTATEVLVPAAPANVSMLGEALCTGRTLLPSIGETATPGLQLVATSDGLTLYETRLSGDPMGVLKVKRSVESLREAGADLVIVDTPPSLGAFTFGVLAAASWALIPTVCEEPSVRTLPSALATVAEARHLNPELRVLAVVANRLDRRTRQGLGTLETLRQASPEYLAHAVLPSSAAIADSMRPGAQLDERAAVNSVVVELAEELLRRMGGAAAADLGPQQSPVAGPPEVKDLNDCSAVQPSGAR